MPASRRTFLSASAATGLAAAAWPGAFAAGADAKALNLALIGAGGQGRHDATRLSRAGGSGGRPAVRIAAVCDVDSAHLTSAEALAADLNAAAGVDGGCRAFADFRELLNETPDLAGVIVATPDHAHAAPSIAAADAGLAVYCEKPLANSVEDCDAMLAAAERNGTVFQVGSHERSNPKVRRACELVRGGALGDLKRVVLQMPTDQEHHAAVKNTTVDIPTDPPPASLDYAAWLAPSGGKPVGPAEWPDMRAVDPDLPGWMTTHGPHFWWRFVSAFGAGEITDRGAHILDVAQLATGRDDADDWEPTKIEATAGGRPAAFYDSPMEYTFTVSFPSGPDYVGTTDGPRGVRFEGERGSLFVAIHGGATTADPPELSDATVDADLGRTPSHHANFLDAIVGAADPFAPARAGHRTAVICHRINAALRTA